MRDRLSRRRILIGTGAFAAATTGSIAIVSDKTTATVTGSFTIPDAETVLADTELQDVRLAVDAQYGFESNAPIHSVELELHAGASPDNLEMLARHTKDDLSKKELTGEQQLQGSLLNTDTYSAENFQPTDGELSTNVIAELRLYVVRDGEVVAEATETDAFTVTVKDEELTVDAQVGGSGEVVFESD
jgi:hypothetical protein